MGLTPLEQPIDTAGNVSGVPQASRDHLVAFLGECYKVSSTISSPIQRVVFRNLVDAAMTQVSKDAKIASTKEMRSIEVEQPISSINRNSSLDQYSFRKAQKIVHSKSTYQIRYDGLFGYLQLECTSWSSSLPDALERDLDTDEKDATHWNIETILTAHLSQWLQTAGLRYGIQLSFSKSLKGLNCRLRSHRAVPDDAKIFQASQLGDLEAVRKLLVDKIASPWDTDSKGFTPLLVSFFLDFTLYFVDCLQLQLGLEMQQHADS